ncbi:hypothetical protein SporoP37_00990 [Sporosarcina sp. P37]|uniref:TRAP transporter substrate-binding protein DctP n=1 Tax=unclassified Sporosarcina TaxID=2647733 RepID=UPI0009BF07EA|nr:MULTISPECIES: TRAP transporter substrate-binding protein DctP [unclassified Sporosarcina]ARD46880.1 hypothetical protein SporoP33_00585 [Sporosarcina sp. P33]ARK23406.1 hypothetical protein SporoP37_00990 [Sporosarcina sp. P37]PID18616.1 hypothetical protein CSV62_07105 [Sporosarcina sp. P35]
MRKNYLISFLLILTVIILAACNSSADDGEKIVEKVAADEKEKITLKLATAQADTHSMTEHVFKPLMEKVTEQTDGQVEFEFYPAEQLGKAADLYDLVSTGVADIGYYVAAYTPNEMPISSALLGIPGLYKTAYEGTMTYHDLIDNSPILETDFLNNGVRPIFNYDAPGNELWSKKKPIKTPQDIKGLKVRVTGEVLNHAMIALDANPVNITLSDMYEGFDRGVYDVLNLNAQSTRDYGMAELIKYGTRGMGFGSVAAGLVINEKVFQGLPEDVQQIIQQVGEELTESNAIRSDEYISETFEKFTEDGIEVYELTEADKEAWNNYFAEIEADWVDKVNKPEFQETLTAFKEISEKYR